MIATYSIKHDGVWYKVGDEIKKTESVNSDSVFSIPYTKTDINRMSTSDLQAFAISQGIANATKINGTELKRQLIEKLGL